jgi:hypothetical protein
MTKIAVADPGPLVKGTDPRIRIRTKMSRIRNTDRNHGLWVNLPFTKRGSKLAARCNTILALKKKTRYR